MAIQSAINFMKKASEDKAFRSGFYGLEKPEIEKLQHETGFSFSVPEFEEAKYILLFKAQTETEAMKIKEIAMWYYMILNETSENPLIG